MKLSLLPDFEVSGYGSLLERQIAIQHCFANPDRKFLEPVAAHDGVLTVVAYGPSLAQTFGGIYKEAAAGNTVMTVSGAHDYLIGRGIVPDYHAEMDIRERKTAFVENSRPEITYLIASVCHPKFWSVLKDRNVVAWHLGDNSVMDEIVMRHDITAIMHPSTQCIGLNALVVGHTLGFRTFSMYGFDCSYADGEPHAGWHNGSNSDNRRMTVYCGDQPFETRAEWVRYARNFMEEMLPRMPGCRFAVHGDGLLQQMLKEGMKERKAA